MSDLKDTIQKKYANIANGSNTEYGAACCNSESGDNTYSNISEDYSPLKGYNKEADLGLGCGLPTEFAKIKEGDVVVDLGCGAGNDCFIARNETGEQGLVIGLDFVDEMLELAKANALKLGYNNVKFIKGDIENIPIESNLVDVVVSNCVLNLVPNKTKAYSEMHRILKTGAHFSISDIVTDGQIDPLMQKELEAYVGCDAGAINVTKYLKIVQDAGFEEISIQKKKALKFPKEILEKYLNESYICDVNTNMGVYSITLYGVKN